MGSMGVQIVCVTLGVLGLIGVIVCCAVPRWKVSSFVGANIVTAQGTYKGLWMECVVQSTGQQQCKNYDSLLILPSDLQAARALTIISAMLSIISLLILFCGADFTTCVESEDVKPKISLVAGVGMLIAGLLVLIPASWSAHAVIREFHSPLSGVQRMELGPCIFIGWGSGVLLLLAGGLLCCFSKPRGSSGGTAKYYSNSASAPKNYV